MVLISNSPGHGMAWRSSSPTRVPFLSLTNTCLPTNTITMCTCTYETAHTVWRDGVFFTRKCLEADAMDTLGYGFVNFDNLGSACLTIFVSITLEGWSDVMYAVMDSFGVPWFTVPFFVFLVMYGSFFLLNLALAVIWDEYCKAAEGEAFDKSMQWEVVTKLDNDNDNDTPSGKHKVSVLQQQIDSHESLSLSRPTSASMVSSTSSVLKRNSSRTSKVTPATQVIHESTAAAAAAPSLPCRVGTIEHTSTHASSKSSSRNNKCGEEQRQAAECDSSPWLRPPDEFNVTPPSEPRPQGGVKVYSEVDTAPRVALPGTIGSPHNHVVVPDSASISTIKHGSNGSLGNGSLGDHHHDLRSSNHTRDSEADNTNNNNDNNNNDIKEESSSRHIRMNLLQAMSRAVSHSRRNLTITMNPRIRDPPIRAMFNHLFTRWEGLAQGIQERSPAVKRLTHACESLVHRPWFKHTITLLIIVNTIVLSIEHHGQPQELVNATETANDVFTFLFLGEMILKLLGEGVREYSNDSFNLFDAVIVSLSVADFISSQNGASSSGSVSARRMLLASGVSDDASTASSSSGLTALR
jgi:hypothetical protein